VLSGTVAASAVTNGTRQPLGQLKAGDTFAEAALMTGNPLLADFTAESHCEVLLIPVSLFQSIIVAEPGAVRHISRTMADRTRMLAADPAKTKAALQQDSDPYGLKLKARDPKKFCYQCRFVFAEVLLLRHD
jgi:cAMP-binding proteins - catabolite gene activator and regulatory subunit of cAMP-dependent protein kinases